MNKDKIKQLRDALTVIKEECASYDPLCSPSCPFYSKSAGRCGFEAKLPGHWELDLNKHIDRYAFT